MTTTVKISAHTSIEKEVLVIIRENGNKVHEFTLQNGENKEAYVFDNREISVIEVRKLATVW
jgi:uncharacterized protein YkuJ